MNKSAKKLNLSIQEVEEASSRFLIRHGVSKKIAQTISATLCKNERDGYASHGVVRLTDYLEDIAKGAINPQKYPKYEDISPLSAVIKGEHCFGILSAELIAKLLKEKLSSQTIAAVALPNGHHIGRISSVISPLVDDGAIVLGFSNYNGLGTKVIGWDSDKALFSTNPLLIATPTSSRPIIFDMSTSTVSEGRVRTAWHNHEEVSPGWLVNKEWEEIINPEYFYETPMKAFLTPLGGYKGFGLSLMVEILSGILSGGSHVGAAAKFGGNSATFIAIRPEIFGISEKKFLEEMDNLLTKIETEYPHIHIPGWKKENKSLQLNASLWEWILTT